MKRRNFVKFSLLFALSAKFGVNLAFANENLADFAEFNAQKFAQMSANLKENLNDLIQAVMLKW